MPRFNLDSLNYNPLTNRSNAAIDAAMRNVDIVDARMWERRNSNPKPQSRKSNKRKEGGYRKRGVKPPKPVKGDTVTVQAGDSLSAILKRTTGSYKNVAEVAKLNGIKDPNKIYVGQKIKIPGYNADTGGDVVVEEDTGGVAGDRHINTSVNKAGAALRNLIARGQKARQRAVVKPDSIAQQDSLTRDSIMPTDTIRKDSVARPDSTRIKRPDTTKRAIDNSSEANSVLGTKKEYDAWLAEQYPNIPASDRDSVYRNSPEYKATLDSLRRAYIAANVNADISGLSGLGVAGAGGALTRAAYRTFKTSFEGIFKGIERPFSSLWRGILAPYGRKGFNKLNNATADRFAERIRQARASARTATPQSGNTSVGAQAGNPTELQGGPYLNRMTGANKARVEAIRESNLGRSWLNRVRGRLNGIAGQRRGYSEPPIEKIHNSYAGLNSRRGNAFISRSEQRALDAARARTKTQSAKPQANTTKPKPTKTKSRKEKLRGDNNKKIMREARRAARNDKNKNNKIVL